MLSHSLSACLNVFFREEEVSSVKVETCLYPALGILIITSYSTPCTVLVLSSV